MGVLDNFDGAFSFGFGGGNAIAVLLSALVVLVLLSFISLAAFFLYRRWDDNKKYNVKVDIIHLPNDATFAKKRYDKGGIFIERKTGLKRFWLKKNKVGLNPDNIPTISDELGREVVTLYQVGLKNFRFVNIKPHANPGLTYSVGDEDVNWAITAFDLWKSKFQHKSWIEQYGFIVLWAITVLATLLLLYMVLDRMDVIQGAASALNSAGDRIAVAAERLALSDSKVIN